MRRFVLTPLLIPALLLTTASMFAQAPHWNISGCNGDEGNTHNNSGGWFHQDRVCELRSAVLPLTGGSVNVTGENGGIEVTGEDRNDIALEARVIAYGSSKANAEEVEHQIKIVANGTIHAEGPTISGWFHRGYTVNYRLRVPRHIAAELHTENGGVDVKQVEGFIHAETTNGGLTLDDLAGDVHGSTVNGGVDIKLTGNSWNGAGLSAKSVNGGISVAAPNGYSAHLVAQTVNGGISVAFPVTVQGTLKHHLDTNIGQGGPTIRLQTVNGGVSISRQ